jgi:hypothetical protein
MALLAVVLGDLLVSFGLIAVPAGGGGGFGPPTLETFAVVAAIGAVAVGPFAFAFLTLPAAAMWTTVLERSRRSTEPL